MGKIYIVTSGKGGVGKTTTAVNLAAALNALDEDVVVVDANLSTPNIGLHFGAPIVPINLSHVLSGKAKIDEAIYEHESGTKLIPGSISIKDSRKINPSLLNSKIKKLGKITDNIILDSAAGLGEETLNAIKAAEEVIIITNPDILALTDALKTIKTAEGMNKNINGAIITRVKREKTEIPLANIKDMLEIAILGIVPEEKAVRESLVKRDAVVHTHPKSKSARTYKNIAARLAGKQPTEKPTFIEKLLRGFGLR